MNKNGKQGFVAKLEKQLIFLAIDAAFDAILKDMKLVFSFHWCFSIEELKKTIVTSISFASFFFSIE